MAEAYLNHIGGVVDAGRHEKIAPVRYRQRIALPQKIRQSWIVIVSPPMRRITYPARPRSVAEITVGQTREVRADVGDRNRGADGRQRTYQCGCGGSVGIDQGVGRRAGIRQSGGGSEAAERRQACWNGRGCASAAILGAGHENEPINVPDDRLRSICAVRAAPVCSNKLQRWHTVRPLLGHW